jgi:pimeloyl-ACP methyl ester carboxylesterase
VAVIVVLLVVNTIVTNAETKSAEADGGRIIDLRGGDLQVREDGRAAAPPVVLIHGWTASIHWFDRLTPLLTNRYRVIRVDLLGHGGSEKPKDGYSMEEQADRVADALARLGVRRALVAGHSTGGEVAIALAARHPQLTRALAVIDTEPDEKFVDPDLLATLSLKPVIGQAMKRLATDGTIRDGWGRRSRRATTCPTSSSRTSTRSPTPRTRRPMTSQATTWTTVRSGRLLPKALRRARRDRLGGGPFADGRAARGDRAAVARPRPEALVARPETLGQRSETDH